MSGDSVDDEREVDSRKDDQGEWVIDGCGGARIVVAGWLA